MRKLKIVMVLIFTMLLLSFTACAPKVESISSVDSSAVVKMGENKEFGFIINPEESSSRVNM